MWQFQQWAKLGRIHYDGLSFFPLPLIGGVGCYSIYSWKSVNLWPCHSLNCLPQNSLNPPLSRPESCQISRAFQKRIPIIQSLIPTLQPLLPSLWSSSRCSPPDASMNLGDQVYKFVLGPCGQDRSRRAAWPVDHSLLASEYFFNDAAHNWEIRILLTHLLGGPVGHRTSSRLWAGHQLWQALGAWAVRLDFCMPLACPCSFRVSPLSTALQEAEVLEGNLYPVCPTAVVPLTLQAPCHQPEEAPGDLQLSSEGFQESCSTSPVGLSDPCLLLLLSNVLKSHSHKLLLNWSRGGNGNFCTRSLNTLPAYNLSLRLVGYDTLSKREPPHGRMRYTKEVYKNWRVFTLPPEAHKLAEDKKHIQGWR